jgi:hypothetical protein
VPYKIYDADGKAYTVLVKKNEVASLDLGKFLIFVVTFVRGHSCCTIWSMGYLFDFYLLL